MHPPSRRLIEEIDAIFEENDPYAVISEVLDDEELVKMMQEQADTWRVLAAGEVHVADPCLPDTLVDLWPKTVMVPDNSIKEAILADELQRPLTAGDFIPAYALNVSGGLEIAANGEHTLALEIEEPVTGISVRLSSSSDPDDARYVLTDLDNHLLNLFDQTELLVILASLAGAEPVDFDEVSPLAQCAAMLSLIGHKYGVSSEEFRTVASLIPDQTERMANVTGAVVYARRHLFKHSATTTAIERLVKYDELDTDMLYRMHAGYLAVSAAEKHAQPAVFTKIFASPASYRVEDIDITSPTLQGTSYSLPLDLNTLDTFSDTVQQVIASAVDKL